jgi:hypothetical protein
LKKSISQDSLHLDATNKKIDLMFGKSDRTLAVIETKVENTIKDLGATMKKLNFFKLQDLDYNNSLDTTI